MRSNMRLAFKKALSLLPIAGFALATAGAFAAAPSVVIDSQETIGNGYSKPESIAVSANGAIYIADTGTNTVRQLANSLPGLGSNQAVSTAPYTLQTPQALALDAAGDLFIGDVPSSGGVTTGRVLEILANANGVLTSTVQLITQGAPLTNPTALAVDSAGTLFIGDFDVLSGINGQGFLYTVPAGTHTAIPLAVTGLNPGFVPGALLRDAGSNLYIADNNQPGGAYIAPAAGGAAQPVNTEGFTLNQPSGLALDAAGDLYILTELGTGTGLNPGQQLIVIPGSDPTNPYIIPTTSLNTSSGVALDPSGNLDVMDYADGAAIQLNYLNPVSLGQVSLGGSGTQVSFNFELNAAAHIRGFQTVTEGDVSTEAAQGSGGTCTDGEHKTAGGGQTISPYYPYVCQELYTGSPVYPGLRSVAIQMQGVAAGILGSEEVYVDGLAGAEIVYPLNVAAGATGLKQPQGLAISGLNQTVYVADSQAGAVYATKGLNGKNLTPVKTAPYTLSSPTAVALNGEGDLYIADFTLGEVIVVPTTTGVAPYKVNSGGLLQHPISLTIDYAGNLYIGDAGPAGVEASSSTPGFIVKVPADGEAAFKVNTSPVSIVFPQALTTVPTTGDLFIGDGGDPNGVGQVVYAPLNNPAVSLPIAGVTQPAGLAFDPANDLYVLDSVTNQVTVDPEFAPNYVLNFNNSSLSSASALAVSAGSQSLVIAGIGGGAAGNSLLFVNGNASTLSFGTVTVGTTGGPQTASVYNIGNASLKLSAPYYSPSLSGTAFAISGGSCAGGFVLNPESNCTIEAEFTPQATGAVTQTVQVESNAYNSGIPTLSLSGTGN